MALKPGLPLWSRPAADRAVTRPGLEGRPDAGVAANRPAHHPNTGALLRVYAKDKT